MAGWVVTVTADAENLLSARIDEDAIRRYITERLNDARNTFIMNMSGGGPSAPGDYPKTDTGRLANSVDFQVGEREGSLYSDVEYAAYLVTGTRKMASRKMLADALEEVMASRPNTDELSSIVIIE